MKSCHLQKMQGALDYIKRITLVSDKYTFPYAHLGFKGIVLRLTIWEEEGDQWEGRGNRMTGATGTKIHDIHENVMILMF